MVAANRFMSLLQVGGKAYSYVAIEKVAGSERLPYSLKVLLENVVRMAPTPEIAEDLAKRVVTAGLAGAVGDEVEFSPARVLFQDFTGVPVFVDFAVMREACEALGGDPKAINPQIPCDLVIDHSVIADEAGCPGSLGANLALEFERNHERYAFLKWAQGSFENVRIVPPGQGICHQLNIEQFASVVAGACDGVALKGDEAAKGRSCCSAAPKSESVLAAGDAQCVDGVSEVADSAAEMGRRGASDIFAAKDAPLVYFDTLVGTDSHTPTANGIGVLGWGVGGIEAEAAALGQPITTLVPRVVGVRLAGSLRPGVTAMDAALTFAQVLRAKGVVGCFAECFGEGVSSLSATQRACIANMTPEYGCTCTLFPVDERTLAYLRLTGRDADQVALVEAYAKAQGMWHDAAAERVYAEVVDIDLSQVECSLAGPSRPHNRFALSDAQERFRAVAAERGLDSAVSVSVELNGSTYELSHGALAIAAVTSCTTATDPAMMLAAGVLARNAAAHGLRPAPWVKTILAPGSHAVELLLERAGLLDGLHELGFHTCGFGCMSCIGNSGPIAEPLRAVASDIELASVLSGNRNFEGRISPDVSQNYLAAPAVVVAYALAGTMDIDLTHDALGCDSATGEPVFLSDIVPDEGEVELLVARYVTEDLFAAGAKGLYEGPEAWRMLSAASSSVFAWDESSTYVRRPPYFDGMGIEPAGFAPIEGAAAIGNFGDFITTDHISPAGSIASDSPAARYLRAAGVADDAFNTYGARRGNHEVMMRGTFANVKLRNKMAGDCVGGWTKEGESGELSPISDVAERYAERKVPLVVLAGKMYGSGSSRDWAAKGPALLGVRAVIAESFERIHRSNLIGMGIVPLQFEKGQSADSLGLDGTERYTVGELDFSRGLPPERTVEVKAMRADGSCTTFRAVVRVDTPTEGRYLHHGGILPYVLRHLR